MQSETWALASHGTREPREARATSGAMPTTLTWETSTRAAKTTMLLLSRGAVPHAHSLLVASGFALALALALASDF